MDHANLFSSNALFSCFYLRIFFTSREKNVLGRIQKEIMDFKKASWPNFCNSFFMLKTGSVGPVDQQINLVWPKFYNVFISILMVNMSKLNMSARIS